LESLFSQVFSLGFVSEFRYGTALSICTTIKNSSNSLAETMTMILRLKKKRKDRMQRIKKTQVIKINREKDLNLKRTKEKSCSKSFNK